MSAVRLLQILSSAVFIALIAIVALYVFGDYQRRELIVNEAVKGLVGFMLGGLLAAIATLLIQLHLAERVRRSGRVQILKDAIGRLVDSANTLRRLAATQDADGDDATQILRIQRVAEAQNDLSRLRHEIGDNFDESRNTLVAKWPEARAEIKNMEKALGKIERELRKKPLPGDVEMPDLLPGLLEPGADPTHAWTGFFRPYDRVMRILRDAIIEAGKLR